MAKNKYTFEAEICECCGQAKTYLLPIDWGTALIVKAVARAVSKKGSRSHKEEYFGAEYHTCTVHEIMGRGSKFPTWEGIDFDIVEGRIVKDLPTKPSLF